MLSCFSDLSLISEVLIPTHSFHIYNNNDTYTNYFKQKRRGILAVFGQILLTETMETGDHEWEHATNNGSRDFCNMQPYFPLRPWH